MSGGGLKADEIRKRFPWPQGLAEPLKLEEQARKERAWFLKTIGLDNPGSPLACTHENIAYTPKVDLPNGRRLLERRICLYCGLEEAMDYQGSTAGVLDTNGTGRLFVPAADREQFAMLRVPGRTVPRSE